MRSVSLRFLIFKVVFLVAITLARCISELEALSVWKDSCIFHSDKVVLRLDPSFITKVNSWFHKAQELVLPDFCPRPTQALEKKWHTSLALKIYIKRTLPFCKQESLFVSFQPFSLGAKVTPSTVDKWLRACIATAYESQTRQVLRSITAHSTRSAATTAT